MLFPKVLSEKVAYRKQRIHRIEALADGVFAIAMTLLVLDLKVPLAEIANDNDLKHSLLHALPEILTFILSFSVAGLFWSSFVTQFNYIHMSDRNENMIAIFYLMVVSFLPFSSSFLSKHPGSRVAVGLYMLNIMLLILILMLHWKYSYHNGLVQVGEGQEPVIHQAIMGRLKFAIVCNSIVSCCCFFSSYLALGGTILLQFVYTFSGFIEMQNFPKKKPAVVSKLLTDPQEAEPGSKS